MSVIRYNKWLGMAALAFLIIALNLLVWTQAFFSLQVLAPLVTSIVLGIIWVILSLLTLAERRAIEDRAVGGLNAVFSTVLFLGICIVLYMFLNAWNISWDLTEEGRRDLSPQTVQVLQAMNTEVEVLCFFLQVDEELVAIARDKTLRFLEQCQRYTPLLSVEVLDPTVDRARLEVMNITHASVQGTIVLRVGERQRVITLAGGSPRLEERDFTNALINVLREAEPKVYFMTGHRERDILDDDEQQGGSILGNLLRGESYHVERLAIQISEAEIPADADIVVVNNPSMDFHPVEIEALDKYLKGGGRLMLLIDPWRSPDAGHSRGEQLRPYMEERLGIVIGSDIVVSDQRTNMWQAELTVDAAPFENIEDAHMEYRGAFHAHHPITRAFDQTMMFQAARSVAKAEEVPDNVTIAELLRTPPDFWAETDTEKLLLTGQANRAPDEQAGPISLAAAVLMNVDKEQSPKGHGDARVVVVGDADFAANGQIIIPGHLNFLMNAFAWLTESEDLIAMRPTGREALPLLLTDTQRRAISWISIMFTVQTIIAVWLVVFIIRRRNL